VDAFPIPHESSCLLDRLEELQLQYTNFKNNLQQIAQKIGDVEQETEEHKYVDRGCVGIAFHSSIVLLNHNSPLRPS